MKYLVILDGRSVIGQLYRNGSNDGMSGDHPVLLCSKLDASHHVYLACTRPLPNRGESHQSLLIPHHAVAQILEFAKEPPAGFGFFAPRDE